MSSTPRVKVSTDEKSNASIDDISFNNNTKLELSHGTFDENKFKSDHFLTGSPDMISTKHSDSIIKSVIKEPLDDTGTIDKLLKLDEDRSIAKRYLHDLLRYINHSDATLNNDVDGDLNFYMNKMPELEKRMTFKLWIQDKIKVNHQVFVNDLKKKQNVLKDEYSDLIKQIKSIDIDNEKNDDFLLNFSNNFNIGK